MTEKEVKGIIIILLNENKYLIMQTREVILTWKRKEISNRCRWREAEKLNITWKEKFRNDKDGDSRICKTNAYDLGDGRDRIKQIFWRKIFGNNDRKLFQIKGKKIEVILMMQEEGRETRKVKWQKKTSTEGGVGGLSTKNNYNEK